MSQDSQLDPARRLSSISFAVHTDPGRRREENQDSFGVIEGHSLTAFMVADGMGGARGGAVASSLAIDLLKSALRGHPNLSCQDIVSVVLQVNKTLAEKGALETSLSGMGTTLVGIAFCTDKTFIFNVGDSRLYRMGKNSFEVCTEDHTLVQELVKSGAIGPEQAKNHPVSHMLTRSLGPTTELKVDCIELKDGPYAAERFLLCSDGLYNQASLAELEAHLREYPKEEAVKRLIDLANSRGGPDNITAIIVELGDEFPKDPSPEIKREPVELKPDSYNVASSAVEEGSQLDDNIAGAPSPYSQEIGELAEPTKAANISNRIFSSLPMIILVSMLTAVAIVLVALLDFYAEQKPSNPVKVTPASPAIVTPKIGVTQIDPKNSAAGGAVTASQVLEVVAKPLTNNDLTPLASNSAPAQIPSININPQSVIVTGEQALLGRQLVLKEKVVRLNQELDFISQSEDQRIKQLQLLNDEKLSLSSKISEINSREASISKRLTEATLMLERSQSEEPLVLAKELAQIYPAIIELYKTFEQATDQYLQALQEQKAFPNSPQATNNLDLKLAARTEAFNALRSGTLSVVTTSVADLQSELSQIRLNANILRENLLENDNQRETLSEIAAILKPQELQNKKLLIQQELLEVQKEIELLSNGTKT